MKIRISGTPQNCSRRFVCKAVRFYASQLMRPSLVETLSIHIVFTSTRGYKGGVNWMDRAERPKKLRIEIRDTLPERKTLEALAHEMVHVKQYATGQVRDYVYDLLKVRWEGEHVRFDDDQFPTDYWFSPWELEAYGREPGLYNLFIKDYNFKNKKR